MLAGKTLPLSPTDIMELPERGQVLLQGVVRRNSTGGPLFYQFDLVPERHRPRGYAMRAVVLLATGVPFAIAGPRLLKAQGHEYETFARQAS